MQFINSKNVPPPKNGNLLLLLVAANYDDDNCHPTEDNDTFVTIGSNSGDDNGEDEWIMAGWDWCSDEFTNTTGEIIGWLELPNGADCVEKLR
jgi:hypothetical protein